MRTLGLLIFVFSGAAGLLFEVALQRSLTRAFGVSALATSSVLAVYMAGLALGAWLFGRWADRVTRPARLYAALEVGIALVAGGLPLVTPTVVQQFGQLAAGHASNEPIVVAGRLGLAFAVTLVPTILMGGTLPAMVRALRWQGEDRLAALYGANLLGAAVGAALGSYLCLPMLGLSGTFFFGAVCNALAALLALLLDRSLSSLPPVVTEQGVSSAPRLFLLLSGWSGFITFVAEVGWFQLLAVVVGTSAYAFGLMLTTFLLGLTLGAWWLARQGPNEATLTTFGKAQALSALFIVITLPLWDKASALFVLAGRAAPPFWVREALRIIACLELIFVPAALLGVGYPLLLRMATRSDPLGRGVGGMVAVNTMGAIAGALLGGFVVLPTLGTRGLLVFLALSLALVGGLLVTRWWRVALAGIAIGALGMPGWNVARLSSGANVYFTETSFADSEVVWWSESLASGLTTVVKHPQSGALTLLTNGKFQGNNSGEVLAQRAISQVPALVLREYDQALHIGVGTGCTLATLAAFPFRHIDAVELSTDILEAAGRHFSDVNENVLASAKVSTHIADGRNFLLLTQQQYSLVSLELSSIWFAGASDLYHREFYQLVDRHLKPGGILQQWVQLHHITRQDLAVVVATLRDTFRHVHLYYVGGQGILLASQNTLTVDTSAVIALSETLARSSATAGLMGGQLLTLTGRLVLDEAGIEQLLQQEQPPIATDDNVLLEYSTPKGNARPDLTIDAMLSSLGPLMPAEHPLAHLDDSPDAIAFAQACWHVGRDDTSAARALLAPLTDSQAVQLRQALEQASGP